MKKIAIAVLVLALIGWWRSQPANITLPAGTFAPAPPEQKNIAAAESFDLNGYKITPLAHFSLDAKVLSIKRYFADREADLAPFDFALGWGVMSDQSVVDTLNIRQSSRWYMYSGELEKVPYSFELLGKSSANMHLVPATEVIESQLNTISVGSIARLRGKLIEANHPDGYRWRSSMTRDDRGGGACELFYLESIAILKQ